MIRHDDKPKEAPEPPPEIREMMERVVNSEYSQYVKNLTPLVKGKTVVGSEAGPSGFVLFLDDESWVEAFLLDGHLRWTIGTGQLADHQRQLLNSSSCGNGREKLTVDMPYAGESCDLQVEIAKAHGKTITRLAIGETAFNFCFPEGRELDAMIVKDANGKPALRVFWEQW